MSDDEIRRIKARILQLDTALRLLETMANNNEAIETVLQQLLVDNKVQIFEEPNGGISPVVKSEIVVRPGEERAD